MAISEFPSIEREIARAWTLPAALYTEGSVFTKEKEKAFRAAITRNGDESFRWEKLQE